MADATPENWRPVVGYEGWYEVSDQGRVRRIAQGPSTRPGRILRQADNGRGYLALSLSRNHRTRRCLVHRLVLAAFVGPAPAGHECNHKDGDKTNNHLSNLEWLTSSGNRIHALATGLLVSAKGERAGGAKLTAEQVQEIRRLKGIEPTRIIAIRFRISAGYVRRLQRGLTWTHLPLEPPHD